MRIPSVDSNDTRSNPNPSCDLGSSRGTTFGRYVITAAITYGSPMPSSSAMRARATPAIAARRRSRRSSCNQPRIASDAPRVTSQSKPLSSSSSPPAK
jgi:hypothetical protein